MHLKWEYVPLCEYKSYTIDFTVLDKFNSLRVITVTWPVDETPQDIICIHEQKQKANFKCHVSAHAVVFVTQNAESLNRGSCSSFGKLMRLVVCAALLIVFVS